MGRGGEFPVTGDEGELMGAGGGGDDAIGEISVEIRNALAGNSWVRAVGRVILPIFLSPSPPAGERITKASRAVCASPPDIGSQPRLQVTCLDMADFPDAEKHLGDGVFLTECLRPRRVHVTAGDHPAAFDFREMVGMCLRHPANAADADPHQGCFHLGSFHEFYGIRCEVDPPIPQRREEVREPGR
jgi:hypothetical protein